MNFDHLYILDILFYYLHASRQGKLVYFFWIPSHVGIHGNSKSAKSEIVKFRIPYTYLKYVITLHINSPQQIFWDFCDTSKLYPIQDKVNKPFNFNLKRRDDVIVSRNRIGHSRLNHSQLLKGEHQAERIFCNCPLTIQHIFLECSDTFHVQDSLFFRNLRTMQKQSLTLTLFYSF